MAKRSAAERAYDAKKAKLEPLQQETHSGAETAEKVDELLDQQLKNITSTRCILIIHSPDDTDESQSSSVKTHTIGTMKDQVGHFYQVTHFIDNPQSVVPNDWSEAEGSVKRQVWPCYMYFRVKLQCGFQAYPNDPIAVSTRQTWDIKIPAGNYGSKQTQNEPTIIGFLPKLRKLALNWDDDDNIPNEELAYHKKHNCNDIEARFLDALLRNGSLYWQEFHTLGRMLVPCNTFMKPCLSTAHADTADLIERLHSDDVKNTKLCFQVILYAPSMDKKSKDRNGPKIPDFGPARWQKAYDDFQTAARTEQAGRNYFFTLFADTPGSATLCSKNSLKAINLMPRVQFTRSLVDHDDEMTYLARSADMHILGELQRLAIREAQKIQLPVRLLKLSESEDNTYGALVEIPADFPANLDLSTGTTGKVEWCDNRKLPHWEFVIAELPGIGKTTDIYLAIRPMAKKDTSTGESYIPSGQPAGAIDVDEAAKSGTLQQLLSIPPGERVFLHFDNDNTTEKQRYKALRIANPSTRHPAKLLTFVDPSRCTEEYARKISKDVTSLMSGQGLKKLGTKSLYSSGFVDGIKKNMDSINKQFATAIGVPGAELSKKQIEVTLDYPSNAPSDGVMTVTGYAGTSKSTCQGLYFAFQHMDQTDLITGEHKAKRGLMLAIQHKTVDGSLATIKPIVKELCQMETVRDYGDKIEVAILSWILNGCPDEYSMVCDGMSRAESAEARDAIRSLKVALEMSAGNRTTRFNGYENTAVWIVANDLGIIQRNHGKPLYEREKIPTKDYVVQDYNPPEPTTESAPIASTHGPDADSSEHVEEPYIFPHAQWEDFDQQEKDEYFARIADKEAKEKEEKDAAPPPPQRKTYTEEQKAKYYNSEEGIDYPKESWERDFWALSSLLIELLQRKATKTDHNAAEDFMREFKRKWYAKKVAVVGTTVSRADSKEMMEWNPTHLAGDEWQYVADPDSLIVFTAHHGRPISLYGDPAQPGPYVIDEKQNGFAAMRKYSWFDREDKRGRPGPIMDESRRTDRIGVKIVSQLFYDGRLKSVMDVHPEHERIAKFYKKTFGTNYRHLFVNTKTGTEEKHGHRNSVMNEGVIACVVKIVELLLDEGFKPEEIGIVAPYALEDTSYRKVLREICAAKDISSDKIQIGSVPTMMGAEHKITILSIVRTDTMGFLNKKGFFLVGNSRSSLSTIVVANNDAIQQTKLGCPTMEFQMYDKILAHMVENWGYCESKWAFSGDLDPLDALRPSMERFQELRIEADERKEEENNDAVANIVQQDDAIANTVQQDDAVANTVQQDATMNEDW